MLIKTTPELKKYFSSIDSDYSFDALQSFVLDAETNLLIPYLGQEIYDVMDAAYNGADPVEGKKLQLLTYLQKAVTHLAFLLSADSGAFRISDSGFYVVSTNTNKPVSETKLEAFRTGRREAGYQAMEQAMLFLEANIDEADFAAYKTSDAHALHRAYFINDSVTFTRYYRKTNKSAYLFDQLLDALDFVERTQIQPVLGDALFADLKTKLLTGNLSADEKILLIHINCALANFTIAKAASDLPIQFDGANIVINSRPVTNGSYDAAAAKTAATAQQIAQLVKDAADTAQVELRNLEDYLVANAAVFPDYVLPEPCTDLKPIDPCDKTIFV